MALKTVPRDAAKIDTAALTDAVAAEGTDADKMQSYLQAVTEKVDRGLQTFAVQGHAGVEAWRKGWPELAGFSNEEVRTVMRYYAQVAGGDVVDDGTPEPPDPTEAKDAVPEAKS